MTRRAAQSRAASVRYYNAPNGLGHALASIKSMAQLARAGAHSYEIRSLATKITRAVASKDVRGELAAIYVWVRDNIRYRFDPVGLEWIQAPARTLAEGAGDCDDLATLIAALVQALGHRARFQTVGPSPNAQEHVYAQAFDGKQWISLDPVLEKRQPTAAPRPHDLGDFARTAPGASFHTFDDGGKMLGFIPSAQDRQLWIFEPWESPQHGHREDLRYRSNDTTGGPPRAYIVPRPSGLDESKMDGLGRIPFYMPNLGGWGFLKAVGHAVGSVAKVVGQGAQAIAPFAALVPGVGTAIAAGLSVGGKLAEVGGGALAHATEKQKRHVAALLKAGASPAAALKQAGVALPMVPGPQGFPVPAQSADLAPMLATLTHLADRSLTEMSRLARGAQRTAYAATTRRAHRAQRAPAKKLIKKWDARAKRYVYVAPTLGRFGITPSFSLNLLGAADPAMASSAAAAVARVRAFVARVGQPPQIKLAELASFQASNNAQAGAAKLSTDGLWGPNSRAAAAYYTDTPIEQLPAVARPFQRYATTWTPPAAVTPAVTPAKAPPKKRHHRRRAPAAVVTTPAKAPETTPAASTEAQARGLRRAAALRALRAVQAFRKARGKSPAIPVAQVRAFQQLVIDQDRARVAPADLARYNAAAAKAVDGLYGPYTQAAMATALGMKLQDMPPYAPGLGAKHKTTPAAHKTPKADKTPRGPTAAELAAERAAAAAEEARAAAAKAKATEHPADMEDANKKADDANDAADVADHEEAKDKAEPAKKRHKKHKRKHAPAPVELHDDAPAAKNKDNTWLWLAGAYYFSRRRAA